MDQTIVRVPAVLDHVGIAVLSQEISNATGRVLVLEGADGAFCRGMSLAGRATAKDRGDRDQADAERVAGERADAARVFAGCLRALRFSGVPTIAVVDGEALGGGVGLAAACDLVLATPRASFGLPELLFGLLPAIVLPVVAERTSPQRARLLALRGQSVSAARALELGLADEVVPEDELAAAVRRAVRDLSRVDPDAVAGLKRHTAEGLDRALGVGAEITAAALADPALAEAMRAFATEGTAPWLTN